MFSERRRGRREKQKCWREISCTERRLKDCKSRWEETSQSCMDLLYWACCVSVVIVSHCCSSQIAQLEGREAAAEGRNSSVDPSVTGKQLIHSNCGVRVLFVWLFVILTLCSCWQVKEHSCLKFWHVVTFRLDSEQLNLNFLCCFKQCYLSEKNVLIKFQLWYWFPTIMTKR